MNFKAPQKYFFLPIAVFSGIFLNYFFPFPYFYLVFLLIFSSFFFLKAHYLHFFSLLLFLGFLRADNFFAHNHSEFSCSGLWQVVDFPSKKIPYGQNLKLKLKKGSCPLLKNRILRVSNFRDKAELGDFFKAELKIKARKIDFYASLPKNADKIQKNAGKILEIRKTLNQRIKNFYPQNYAWVEALLIGNKTDLTFDDRTALSRSGTSHMVAISGLHLGIFSAFFYFLIKKIVSKTRLRFRVEPHSAGLWAALIFSFIALILSGMQVPTLRAWLMISALFSGWFFKNSLHGIWALWLSLIPVLFLEPSAPFKAGFWLSYLATASIILSYPKIKERSLLGQFLILQILITLTLYPLVWAYFGGISLISPLINLMLIPLLPYLLILLLTSLIFPNLAGISNDFLELLLNPIFVSSSWDFSYLIPNFQPSILAGILISLSFLFFLAKFKKISLIFLIFAAIFTIFLIFNREDKVFNTREKMGIFFYKNQVVILNSGYRLKERSEAEFYLLPYLRRRAVKADFLILTKDSIQTTGGLLPLKRQYPNLKIISLDKKAQLAFDFDYCGNYQFLEKNNADCALKKELKEKLNQ